nr:hypothetical protein GTC16762_17640 [Pigmentibacter ruber]
MNFIYESKQLKLIIYKLKTKKLIITASIILFKFQLSYSKEIINNSNNKTNNLNDIDHESHEANIDELKKSKVIKLKENKNTACELYEIKEGETITSILRKKKYFPIYGENGFLKKTLEINPNISSYNITLSEGESICLLKNELINENKLNNIDSNFHSYYLESGIKYLRLIEIDSTSGTEAKLLSRAIPFIETGFIQNWTKDFKSYLGINYSISQIMQSDSSVVIGDSIIRITNYFLGLNYKFNSLLYSELLISYGDTLVVRAVGDNTLKIEKMSNTKFKFLGGINFLNFENIFFNSELGFLLNTKFNNEIYNSDYGKGYEGALLVIVANNGWNLRGRIYYSHYSTYVQPVTFDYTEVGISIRLTVDLE